MADLAEGYIHISVEDIELKSRDNTHVSSYKISVPAEDLAKAMDPTLWPLMSNANPGIWQLGEVSPILVMQNWFTHLQDNVIA